MAGLSHVQLSMFLGFYIIICFGLMYFCVTADPMDSPIAYKLQVTLPNKSWQLLSKLLPDKQMKIASAIADRALVLVYLAVVLGCWTIVFWFIYPWIDQSNHVSTIHKYVGVGVFVACFGSWRKCSKSSPGIIVHSNFKEFDHYPYDHLLFVPGKRCETTKLLKIPRSKFDRLKYHQNVPRYDHFCGWVYNTIGEQNYRWFLLFLLVHVIMCAYGSTVCGWLFWGEIQDKDLLNLTFFDRRTGEKIQSNTFITFQYLFARYTFELGVFAVMFVMGIALGAFLSYHIWLTCTNQTTNENSKWSDIKKWYKKQTKKHKQAVKEGLIKQGTKWSEEESSFSSSPEKPEVNDDGDVGCTGGGGSSATSTTISKSQNQQQKEDEIQQEYFDPGPVPKNLYDRGLVENWKEVIYPISLRPDALRYAGHSKPYTAQAAAESKKRQEEKKKGAATTQRAQQAIAGKSKST